MFDVIRKFESFSVFLLEDILECFYKLFEGQESKSEQKRALESVLLEVETIENLALVMEDKSAPVT